MRVYLARLGRWEGYSGTFRTGQVTGGDDGFTPPPGAAVTKAAASRFHSPPSASTLAVAASVLRPQSLLNSGSAILRHSMPTGIANKKQRVGAEKV